jgi:thiamine-monophosphate kinase
LCCESGVGARIEAENLPLDSSLTAAAQSDDEAVTLALAGGEDSELLFTVDPRRAGKLPRELHGVPLTRIGEITEKTAGLKIRRANRWVRLRIGGFRHF